MEDKHMNHVELLGRLTKDIELRYSQGENATAVGRATIAVNRKFSKEGQQQADFINLVAFGKQAETLEKYVKKGHRVLISGRITTGSYTNKDGQKVYTTEVTVEDFEFIETKNSALAASNEDSATTSTPAPDESGFMDIPDGMDDDLPFS